MFAHHFQRVGFVGQGFFEKKFCREVAKYEKFQMLRNKAITLSSAWPSARLLVGHDKI
jgi:hypothetical protein